MNLLLINDKVKDYNTFVENVKSDTIPLVYPFAENSVLPDNIERIGIVFYGSPIIDSFIEEHLERLVKKYNITTVDFLGCNTLKYPTWTNYYNTLINNTGVRIGASDNNTGNLKYGGDWIMESTAQDIKAVYFTEGIENYSTLLDNDGFGFSQTNEFAFAALKFNGSVVTWGYTLYGGSPSSAVLANLTSGVKRIFSTDYAFAALKNNGSVVTWGLGSTGGNSSEVSNNLTDVKYIAGAYSSEYITEATTFLNDELEYIQEIEIATDVEVTFNITGDTTYQGDISGTGKIIKTGTGILTLTGDITFQSLTEAGNTYIFSVGQPITPIACISVIFNGPTYTYTLTTADGNLNGLTLAGRTITGTPIAAFANKVYTIKLTNETGIEWAITTITITTGKNTLSYPNQTYNFIVGQQIQPIVATVTTVSGPTYSIISNPTLLAGLSVDPSTGTITGTPTEAVANKEYTIILTDGNSVECARTIIILDVKTATVVVVKEQLQYNGGVVTCTVVTKIKEKI